MRLSIKRMFVTLLVLVITGALMMFRGKDKSPTLRSSVLLNENREHSDTIDRVVPIVESKEYGDTEDSVVSSFVEGREHSDKTDKVINFVASRKHSVVPFVENREHYDTTDGVVPFVIVTVIRSGSTLLGDILQTDPNTFYIFEPLVNLARRRKQLLLIDRKESVFNDEDILRLEKYFTCDFSSSNIDYLHPFLGFSRTTKPFWYCFLRTGPGMAWDQCGHIITDNCKKSKFRFLKTVRLPMRQLTYFMDKYPKMKILHLIRDPRASQSSLHYPKDVCRILCDKIYDNIKTESLFHLQYPGRIKRVYFEEIASDPIGTARNLYNFIGLKFDKIVESYIFNITSAGNHIDGYVGSVRPNSSEIIYNWRMNIRFQILKKLENMCEDVFENTWYIKCNNESDLKNLSVALYGKF